MIDKKLNLTHSHPYQYHHFTTMCQQCKLTEPTHDILASLVTRNEHFSKANNDTISNFLALGVRYRILRL